MQFKGGMRNYRAIPRFVEMIDLLHTPRLCYNPASRQEVQQIRATYLNWYRNYLEVSN